MWIVCSPIFFPQNRERRILRDPTPHLLFFPPPPPPLPAATALPFAHPLDEFYARAGLRLPAIERIGGEEIPQPYRGLLVHEDDMTPTLEKYHGAEIHLRILGREQREDFYFREVVLQL